MANSKTHWSKRVSNRFWGFAVAVLAMICLMILTLTGNDDNKELVSAFSSIMGAGFWSGVTSQAPTQTKNPPIGAGD